MRCANIRVHAPGERRIVVPEATRNGGTVADMTAQDLAEHLEALGEATEEEQDKLLHDLLVHVYATREAQDS